MRVSPLCVMVRLLLVLPQCRTHHRSRGPMPWEFGAMWGHHSVSVDGVPWTPSDLAESGVDSKRTVTSPPDGSGGLLHLSPGIVGTAGLRHNGFGCWLIGQRCRSVSCGGQGVA